MLRVGATWTMGCIIGPALPAFHGGEVVAIFDIGDADPMPAKPAAAFEHSRTPGRVDTIRVRSVAA